MSQNNNNNPQREGNELLRFFLGIILLGVGLFLFSQQVMVSSSVYHWGFMTFGGRNYSNGLVAVPLIIGIIMLFYNPKSAIARVIIVLGAIFIIATVIMSINFRFQQTTLYIYILMLGMMAAGSGLLLSVLFKKNKN